MFPQSVHACKQVENDITISKNCTQWIREQNIFLIIISTHFILTVLAKDACAALTFLLQHSASANYEC